MPFLHRDRGDVGHRCMVLVALLAGCAGSETAGVRMPLSGDQLAGLPTPHWEIRSGEQSGDVESGRQLGSVLGARLTPDGDMLWVLDASPPHLKGFSRTGESPVTALPSGEGPGEARMPIAFAVSGRGVIVADLTGRFQLFDHEGRLIMAEQHPGVRPLAMLPCPDGSWLLYGPRRDPTEEGATRWINRLGDDLVRIDPGSALNEPLEPGQTLGYGRAHGLTATPDGHLLLRHDIGQRPRLLELDCTASTAREVGPLPGLPAIRMRRTGSGTDRGIASAPGMIGMGVASLGAGILRADLVIDATKDSTGPVTEFTYYPPDRSEAPSVLRISGAYAIRDAVPGTGVLFDTNDPTPRLLFIAADSLLGLFSRAP